MKYQWRNGRTGQMLRQREAENGWIEVPAEIEDAAGMGETWEVTIWREGHKPRVVSLDAPDYTHARPDYHEH